MNEIIVLCPTLKVREGKGEGGEGRERREGKGEGGERGWEREREERGEGRGGDEAAGVLRQRSDVTDERSDTHTVSQACQTAWVE